MELWSSRSPCRRLHSPALGPAWPPAGAPADPATPGSSAGCSPPGIGVRLGRHRLRRRPRTSCPLVYAPWTCSWRASGTTEAPGVRALGKRGKEEIRAPAPIVIAAILDRQPRHDMHLSVRFCASLYAEALRGTRRGRLSASWGGFATQLPLHLGTEWRRVQLWINHK
jgi:hypothetical protein